MRLCPVHDLHQFLPVIHFLKRNLFHRRPGNDHSVVIVLSDILKFDIKGIQMAGRCIFGFMACHRHKRHVHLKRRIGQRTQQLKLCLFFQRHQIQDQNLQRANILMNRPVFVHDKYIFPLQNFFGRQIGLYLLLAYFSLHF